MLQKISTNKNLEDQNLYTKKRLYIKALEGSEKDLLKLIKIIRRENSEIE